MTDLNALIPPLGGISDRALAAISAVKKVGADEGVFSHNDVEITVYPDSTVRELHYVYLYNRLRQQTGRD